MLPCGQGITKHNEELRARSIYPAIIGKYWLISVLLTDTIHTVNVLEAEFVWIVYPNSQV